MISGWVVALALTGVVAAALLLALLGGWRPGRGVRRNSETVCVEVRDRLALPVQDWWTVRRSVTRGRAAPERLRPAARELAGELVRFQEESRWPPPRRVLVVLLAGLYLLSAVGWTLADGLGWATVLRPIPTVLMAGLLLAADAHSRTRIHRARELNS